MPTGVYVRADWHRKKISEINKNENNPFWKGDGVSKAGLHRWIERKLGKPMVCSECKTTDSSVYHWANISGEYKRDINDFKRLCPKCHKTFDHHLLARGESHGMAKLNKEQVAFIRKTYADGNSSYSKLAKAFNVDKSNIYLIIKNINWREDDN